MPKVILESNHMRSKVKIITNSVKALDKPATKENVVERVTDAVSDKNNLKYVGTWHQT